MKTTIHYLLPLLLLSLLTSCYGDNTWELLPEDKSVPPRTTTGADILVCMVNNDLNVQVYREIGSIMPSIEEVNIYRRQFDNDTGTEQGYLIATHLRPDVRPWTDLWIAVKVDKPQLNKAYKLFDYETPEYEEDFLDYRYRYEVDSNASMIRFTRLDSLVGAGEFAFKATNPQKGTVLLRGYFDIPFEK